MSRLHGVSELLMGANWIYVASLDFRDAFQSFRMINNQREKLLLSIWTPAAKTDLPQTGKYGSEVLTAGHRENSTGEEVLMGGSYLHRIHWLSRLQEEREEEGGKSNAQRSIFIQGLSIAEQGSRLEIQLSFHLHMPSPHKCSCQHLTG